MTESLADGPDWHLRSWSRSGLTLFSTVDEWSGCSIDEFHWCNSWGKGADEDACGFAKTFPDIPCVSQMLGGPSLRHGVTKECLNIPSGIGCAGNDTDRLVKWKLPLRIDSASWKSLKLFIQFTLFCNSCTLPESFKIVFWFSMSFRLATVSKAELWNFRNSSISVRLRWWASRNSNFCCHNCPWRSQRSSSAWAAWSSSWLTLSWCSAIIVCLCSSSRVLICAFELLHSSGCPDRSTISPSGCPDLSDLTDDDNWLTDTPPCTK